MLMQRKIVNINKDWIHLEDNQKDVQRIDKVKDWQSIDLPHTCNQWDAEDSTPGYRRDSGCYRKEIKTTGRHRKIYPKCYDSRLERKLSCD